MADLLMNYIGLSLDDFEDFEEKNVSTITKKDAIKNDNTILIKKLSKYVVDMGLPSGTLWGRYNVGVDIYQPLEIASQLYGHYYAWAEVNTKDSYTWDTYKTDTHYKIKLSDKPKIDTGEHKILCLEEDAAYNEMRICGAKIPTIEQFEELLKYCNFLPVEKMYGIGPEHRWDKNIESLDGIVLISKINGNQIFFPVNGYYNGSQQITATECGLYWTANQSDRFQQCAIALTIKFPKSAIETPIIKFTTQEKRMGLSIRPVINIM